MTVRVAVNLVWLVPGVVGGSEEATLAALRAVAEAPDAAGTEVVLFGTPRLFDAHPDLVDRFETRTVGASTDRLRRVLAEATELPAAIGAIGAGLVHHAGGVLPFRSPRPACVAVHDIQPVDLPHNFSFAKRRWLGAMLPRTVRSANAITVPSAFVRDRLVERLGAPAERVSVVPWSVEPVAAVSDTDIVAARRRHGLDRRYVLYPAISYPHKNHAVLVDAVARLAGEPTDLVLTGRPGPLDDEIAARAAAAGLEGRFHQLGRVPGADLRALLAGAAAVAVPSRYEGFGLPALEAMSAGRPVVVADCGSLPEVTAGAAPVVDPDDVDGWVAALTTVLDDPDERARLVAAGSNVAASMTPQRTASALLDAWSRCIDPASAPPRTAS